MENNIVKEVNVDNVIPVGKPKSGLSIQQLDETLLVLYDRLTRINKYPVKDISINNFVYTDGVFEDDGSGIFNDFYIGLNDDFSDSEKRKNGIECHFKYVHKSDGKFKHYGFYLWCFGKAFRFPKREMSSETKRKQMAIWLASKVYVDYEGISEEELDKLFHNSEFSEEHDVIRWDLI